MTLFYYVYTEDGTQYGPLSREQLKEELKSSGVITPRSFVWGTTLDAWTMLCEVPELQSILPQPMLMSGQTAAALDEKEPELPVNPTHLRSADIFASDMDSRRAAFHLLSSAKSSLNPLGSQYSPLKRHSFASQAPIAARLFVDGTVICTSASLLPENRPSSDSLASEATVLLSPKRHSLPHVNAGMKRKPLEPPPDNLTYWGMLDKQMADNDRLASSSIEQALFLNQSFVSDSVPAKTLSGAMDGSLALKAHLHACGGDFEELAASVAAFAVYRQKMEDLVVVSLSKHMAQEAVAHQHVANVKAHRESYLALDTAYLSSMRKMHSLDPRSVASAAQIAAASRALTTQRAALDLQRFEMHGLASEAGAQLRLASLRSLADTFKAQQDYFQSGMDYLAKNRTKIDKLNAALAAMEDSIEQTRAQRDSDYAALLETSRQALDKPFVLRGPTNGIRDQLGKAALGVVSLQREGRLYFPLPDWEPVMCKVADGVFTWTRSEQLPVQTHLLLCSVREPRELNLVHAFELVSPTRRTTFLASSADELDAWVATIQASISQQLNSQPLTHHTDAAKQKRDQQVLQLQSVPGNDVCADCGTLAPEWISLSLGVLVCLECSGLHRKLGVHLSKIRSLKLDAPDASLMKYLTAMGNAMLNARVWEETLVSRCTVDTTMVEMRQQIMDRIGREKWIRNKYELLEYIDITSETVENMTTQLRDAIISANLCAVLKLIRLDGRLAHAPLDREGYSALHYAVLNQLDIVAEMLLQNGALVDALDSSRNSALHFAAQRGDLACVQLLLLRGADPTLHNFVGLDASMLAVQSGSQACVNLLSSAIDTFERKRHSSLPLQPPPARPLQPQNEPEEGFFAMIKQTLSLFLDKRPSSAAFGTRMGQNWFLLLPRGDEVLKPAAARAVISRA